jgi:hypothetical protein
MNKWPIWTIVAIFTMSCGQARNSEVPGETASPQESVAPLAEKVGEMFDGAVEAIAEGDISRGVRTLLDITLMTGPEAGLPEGFKAEIDRAKEAFAENDTPGGREHIVAALKIWDPEKAEAAAVGNVESGTPVPVAQAFKDKILAARDLMIRGEAKSAATAILEALQVIFPERQI